jgi:hypothetical protein
MMMAAMSALPNLMLSMSELAVAEAVDDVVVHEAGRLHMGIDDGAADEGEAALF